MRPEDWERAEEWFHRLTPLGAVERANLIEEVSRADPTMAVELASLLAAHGQTGVLDRLEGRIGNNRPAGDLAGARISHYEVVERIGMGGMGDVYRGRDVRLGRDVALKLLPVWLNRDPVSRDRLFQEARAVCAIDHTNVCALLEIEALDEGHWCLVMPYYEGRTVAQLLADGPVPHQTAVEIGLQTARGLAAAHASGIVHRDIKPSNLLVTATGQVKILDFGVAKLTDVNLTRTGESPGTASYMSPEQRAGREVDGRSDLWSLGAVLYEMLTGHRPAVASELAAALSGVPGDLAGIVRRLLADSPADRYPDAGSLIRDLSRAAGTRVEGRISPAAPAKDQSPRWRFGVVAALLGAVVFGSTWIAVGGAGESSARTERRVPPAVGAPPASSAVAVLPLRSVGLDSVWYEGLADLLSFNLDDVPGLRKADPTVVLGAWRRLAAENGTVDAHARSDLARSLGADYLVDVTAVRLHPDSDVRLVADVSGVSGSARRGRVTVEGPTDSLLQLVDRLTLEILRTRLLPIDGDTPPVNLSSLTTSSLDAMTAYLDGEREYRRGRYSEAVLDFRRAVELDSTFARALYRLGNAYAWMEQEVVANEYFARATRHADRLPERDRRLIGEGSYLQGSESALESFTAEYPEDADGWIWLGEMRFHRQGRGFLPMSAYREAFERALELAPHYEQAYYHLLEDAFARLDGERARELLRGLDAIDPGRTCRGIGVAYDLRWADAATRRRTRAGLDTLSDRTLTCAFVMNAAASDLFERAETVHLAELPALSVAQAGAVFWRMFQARLWNGQPAAAHRLIDQHMTIPRFVAANRLALHLAGYTRDSTAIAWAVDVLTDTPLVPADAAWSLAGRTLNHTYLGALALQEGRWEELDRQVGSLLQSADDLRVEHPERADTIAAHGIALRELALMQRGDLTRLGSFEAVIWKLPFTLVPEPPTSWLRYEAGKLLFDEGRLEDAKRYFQAIHPRALSYYVPAQYYLGRVHEELGQPDAAREHYGIFVEWWSAADPALQPWVNEGRAALGRVDRQRRE